MSRYFKALSLSSLDDVLCAVTEISAAAPLAGWSIHKYSSLTSHDASVYEVTAMWLGEELRRTTTAWTVQMRCPFQPPPAVSSWIQESPTLSVSTGEHDKIFSMQAVTQEALNTIIDILRHNRPPSMANT